LFEKKQVKHPDKFIEVEHEIAEEIFTKVFIEPTIEEPIFDEGAIPTLVEKPDEETKVPFFAIENAPIYPGCENAKDNASRKKCMSQKITKLIQRKFYQHFIQE